MLTENLITYPFCKCKVNLLFFEQYIGFKKTTKTYDVMTYCSTKILTAKALDVILNMLPFILLLLKLIEMFKNMPFYENIYYKMELYIIARIITKLL